MNVERKGAMLNRLIVLVLMLGFTAANPAPAAEQAPKAPGPATRPTTRPVTRPATRPVRHDVKVEEFDRMWRSKKYVLLDVRTKEEFVAGHIPGAVHLNVNDPDFEKKVAALPKDRPYLVNCRSGARSTRACDKMLTLGFADVYNLEGGILAWQKADKEVTKKYE